MNTIARQQTVVTHGNAMPESPDASARTVRLAYLLSQYPALSHTFFLKEVLGLRARGLHIEVASINRPDRDTSDLSNHESEEESSTVYIKDGRWASALLTLLMTALTNPAAVLRGLAAVFKLRGLTLRQRGFWLYYLAEAMLVGRWMRVQKLDHLHVHFGGPVASVGLLTSIAWKVPYSLTIHGPEELLDVRAYHLREKIQQAKFVICISDFCKSQLCLLAPVSEWNKLFVVRLGVDPLVLTPRRSQVNQKSALQIVCTGRLVVAKGHHILLEALRLLRERGIDFHLTLIGTGPERKALEYFLVRHNMTDVVTMTSGLSHDAALDNVRRADIFALASFAEGIPVALMEAMSLGVPCVSTTIAGIPELIESGEDGLLVSPANALEMAEALEALAIDPSLRQRLGNAGRQRIISDYNLPLHQERLAQCFRERTGPAFRGRASQ